MDSMDSKVITQIAIVVDDIKRTAENYSKLFDLPMPEIVAIPPSTEIPAYYRGRQVDGSGCRLCVFDMGNTVLELVQPDMSRPNSWRDWYERNGGPGVQHIGFVVEDRDSALRALEKMGAEVYHVGFYPDMSYTFVDSRRQLGVELNVKQFGMDNRELMENMKEAPERPLSEIIGGGET